MFGGTSSFSRLRAAGPVAASPRADRGNTAPLAASRDLRIDLIRGLALWMIFLDHLPGNALSRLTYGHFALADALDIFVLLSGLSCGILYGKLIRLGGFPRAESQALRRAGQLYLANVFIGLVNVACYFAFRRALDAEYIPGNDLTLLAHDPLRAIGAMVALLYTPQMMDILPLYMVLVLATPAIILLLMRSEALALALSAGLWLAAALVPQLTVPGLGTTGAVSFNPLSWQFLFCVGLWLGKRHFIDGVAFRPRPWLVGLCWIAVVTGFVVRHPAWFTIAPDGFALYAATAVRTHVHPARLLNVLASAYLVATYLPAGAAWLRSRWAAPLALCGRHSLEVFCIGAAISIVGNIAIRVYGATLPLEIVVTATGFAAMVGMAWWRERGRVRRPRTLGLDPGSRTGPEGVRP